VAAFEPVYGELMLRPVLKPKNNVSEIHPMVLKCSN